MAAAVHQQIAQQQYRQQLNAAAAHEMQRRMEQVKRDQRQINHNIERERELQKEIMQNQHRIERQREQERQRREQERREQERAAEERDNRRMERMLAAAVPPPSHAHAHPHGHGHYMRGPVPDSGPPRTIPDREREA